MDGCGNPIPCYFSPVDLYPVSTSSSSFEEDLEASSVIRKAGSNQLLESLCKTGVLPSTWFNFGLVLLLSFWFWWVLYSKKWFCAGTCVSCYCIISSWIYWFCSAQNVPSSSHLHSYLFFSFLPTRFALMPLFAVLPRGRQKVKQEKAVFPYGMSAVSCRVLCKESKSSAEFCHGSATPLMEGSPLGLHSSHSGVLLK